MKRNRILILLVLCILMLSGLAACQSQSGVQGGAASPQAAVEALYRAQQARDADALLACYPPQVRDYILEQVGGKKEYKKSVEQGTADSIAVDVFYTDEKTYEMTSKLTQVQKAYTDKGIEITMEEYADVYCSIIVNGDADQAQDKPIPCGKVGGVWYVLY